MDTTSYLYSLDELDAMVKLLKQKLDQGIKVITFTGPLGAGKTTLIRALLRSLGVPEPITSPTFAYVNTYQTQSGVVHHFDIYRINTLDEFLSQGFDEYLYEPNAVCLIEWPAVIEPLLKHDVCHITLDYADDKRILNITCL